MSVTRIRKISNTSLLVLAFLAIVVLALFFLGGYVDSTVSKPEPVHADTLFYLMYFTLGVTLLAMLYFAIAGFAASLGDPKRRKAALGGLLAIIAAAVLLGVTYAIGSTGKLLLSVDFQKYNTDFYLKFADMWLYSIYTVLGLNIIALVVFAIKGAIKK